MSGSGIRTQDRAVAMDRATVDGAELEYEAKGSGDPVLLIPPGPVAGAFLPFLSEQVLVERYRVIRYQSLEAYGEGDGRAAMAAFLSVVSGLDWETCRAVTDEHIPGGADRALDEADFFFGSDLPALQAWMFGPEQAASISQPVLSVLGSETERWFVDSAQLLRDWFPQIEELTLEGAGHLLQMQRPAPVAEGLAEFLGRHPCAAG